MLMGSDTGRLYLGKKMCLQIRRSRRLSTIAFLFWMAM